MAKFAHLVMVTSLNNNKFYDMKEEGDTFVVTYGRIGSSSVTATYPMSDWNKKYREKIRKGYVDMTDMVKTAVPQDEEKDGYKPIEDAVIAEVFRYLQRCSRQVIRENYMVSSDAVTMEMVNAAQDKLNALAHSSDFRVFNEQLLELFTILPRQMTNVRSYLASSNSDFGEIVQREQDLLDVMRGQVVTAAPIRKSNQKMADCTLLEAIGIEVEPATDEEKQISFVISAVVKHTTKTLGESAIKRQARRFTITWEHIRNARRSCFGTVPRMKTGSASLSLVSN